MNHINIMTIAASDQKLCHIENRFVALVFLLLVFGKENCRNYQKFDTTQNRHLGAMKPLLEALLTTDVDIIKTKSVDFFLCNHVTLGGVFQPFGTVI